MAKIKSMKPSIVTLNPHLLSYCLSHLKNNPRCPQFSSKPLPLYLFIFLAVSIISLLSFVTINPFQNPPPISVISSPSSYSPLFLASLSSVFSDPSAKDSDAAVSLSTSAMVPLPARPVVGNASEFWEQPDGGGFRPCLDFSLGYRRKSGRISKEKKRFLMVIVSGGLFQMRNQIIDAVVVARILEAALVLPVLQGDESEFSEIFDVEHFKRTLKADIRVVSSLPSTHLQSMQPFEYKTPHNVPPFWIRAKFFKKLNTEGLLVLKGLDSRLSKNLPRDLQKLRCKVAFHALRFSTPIRQLGNRIARRMWIEGPYIAIHLRLEKDVWVRTGCLTGLGPEYDSIITRERESDPDQFLTRNSNRSCPLNALDIARLLKALGAPENARIYIAGGKPFGGSRALLPLKAEFKNVLTKEKLARDGELEEYANRSSVLTAIDYVVSLSSDVFVPSHDGRMAQALQGHRAYVGRRKFVKANMSSEGQPELRNKRRRRDVTAFPIPECMCKQ